MRTHPRGSRTLAGALTLALALLGTPDSWAQEASQSDFQKNASVFSQKCTKCHTIGKGDRVGPDLKGLLDRRDREWSIKFIMKPSQFLDSDPVAVDMLKKYNGVRMDDLNLSRDQAQGVVAYIEAVSQGPVQESEVVEATLEEEKLSDRVEVPDEGTGLAVHWFALALVILVGGGTLAARISRTAGAIVLVVGLCTLYSSLGGRQAHSLVGNQQGYSPEQPIAFSHAVHAGKLEIACLYCHHGAEKGPVAGVPSVNICMNCHRIVRNPDGSQTPSTELAKLEDVWNSRGTEHPRLLQWVRVHNLPDFVTFNHKAHVQNNVQCQECHGHIEQMTQVRQASDLSMGWCVNCHRHPGRPAPSHWKRSLGPLDCSACHQ